MRNKYIHTITEDDVSHSFNKMKEPWYPIIYVIGRLLPCDVGKQVWQIDGLFYIENDEQLATRLAVGGVDRARVLSTLAQLIELETTYNKQKQALLAELETISKGGQQ